jgi:hypothetical protein
MAGGFNGYRAALVRHQLRPGLSATPHPEMIAQGLETSRAFRLSDLVAGPSTLRQLRIWR